MSLPRDLYSTNEKGLKYKNLKWVAQQLVKNAHELPSPTTELRAPDASAESTLLAPESTEVGVRFVPINALGATTLVISTPGLYLLTDDLVFSPTNPIYTAGIHVTSSDVTIDMASYTLSFAPPSPPFYAGGILIDTGATNVVVKNGTILNFSTYGILARDGGQYLFDELRVINCGPAPGVALPGGSITAGGILGVSSQDVVVSNCEIYQNAGFGVGFGDCGNISLEGCHVDSNRDLVFPGGRSLYPFGALLSGAPFDLVNNTITVKNCTFNHNRANHTLYGVAIFTLLDSYPPLGVQPALENVLVQDVQIMDNEVGDTDVTAVYFTIGAILLCRNLRVQNVTIDKLGNTLPANFAGFSVEVQGMQVAGNSAECLDCCVTNVYGNSTLENMTGINSELTANNLIFKRCTVQDVTNNVAFTRSSGFNFNEFVGFPGITESPAVSVLVEDCVAQNVRSVATGPGLLTAPGSGFFLQACRRCVFRGNVSMNNQIGFDSADIAPGLESLGNIISDNLAIGNLLFGFRDLVPNSFNAYYRNEARDNVTNYQGLPQFTPIYDWTVGRPMPSQFTPLDNLSIMTGATPYNCCDLGGRPLGFGPTTEFGRFGNRNRLPSPLVGQPKRL